MVEKTNFSQEVEKNKRSVENRMRVKLYKRALCNLGLKADRTNMRIFKDCLNDEASLEQFVRRVVWESAEKNKVDNVLRVEDAIKTALSFDEKFMFISEHEILIEILYAMRLAAVALAISLQPPIYIVIPSIALVYALDIKGYSERPNMLTAKIAMGVYVAIFVSMIVAAVIK
ncbi:MAG: hypothetical protein WA087_03235 [Candidatus Saccharimonadales bacterium]